MLRNSWLKAHRSAVAQGLCCLRAGAFFDAHEHFEAAWREAEPPVRPLLQGLAQLAASHHQLTLGRGRAAVRTWLRAREKLRAAQVVTSAFCDEMDAFHARLGLTAEGPRFIDPHLLGPVQAFPSPDESALDAPVA